MAYPMVERHGNIPLLREWAVLLERPTSALIDLLANPTIQVLATLSSAAYT